MILVALFLGVAAACAVWWSFEVTDPNKAGLILSLGCACAVSSVLVAL